MTQYIDKAALMAEIQKRWGSLANKNVKTSGKYDIEICTLLSIKSFIDTLEVKEVDLEKEMAHAKDLLIINDCYIKKNPYSGENVLGGLYITDEMMEYFHDDVRVKVIIIKDE